MTNDIDKENNKIEVKIEGIFMVILSALKSWSELLSSKRK